MKNVSQVVEYRAYNISTGAWVTGDSANHTITGMQDGTKFTPAASPTQIDATNLPGLYKISIAATENIGNLMLIGGISSTTNVQLIDARWSNDPIPGVVRSGVAQAGAASTITLDANASATNNIYNGCRVAIVAGTGVGQGDRIITGYVGSTQVATVDTAWTTNPDSTSVFVLIPAAVDVRTWLTTLVTGATPGIPDVNTKNIANAAAALDANNLLKVDTEDWKGGVIPAVNVTGVPKVDMVDILGTAVSAPATAGILDVNVKNINNVATTAVTTIRAFIGQTQDLVFNANNFLKVSLNDILGTTLTETAGQLAAGFKKWFNVASPTSTMNEITLVDTTTNLTNAGPDTAGTTTLLGRLTSTRAGYLDNLSGGAVALASVLGTPAGASIAADIASIKSDTGTTIPALIAALNNLSAAQVKTQVVAALNTDTYAEPGQGTPAATNTIVGKLGYLFKAWLNQSEQTPTSYTLYNNAGNTVDQKATVSDTGTVFEITNIVSGP